MENLQRELKLNFFLEMKRINTLYQIQIHLVFSVFFFYLIILSVS